MTTIQIGPDHISNSNFDDILEMHRKYGFMCDCHPRLLSDEVPPGDEKSEFAFRYEFMYEELREFQEAHMVGDISSAADALIDLVVVAMGTAVQMGLPWQDLWDDVHRANMSKVRGVTGRGVGTDLVKPEGWTPPQTQRILDAHRLLMASSSR